MALVACRECQHEVSDVARACPQCGAPFPGRRHWQGTGYDWKSRTTVCGYPLVHIAYGRDARGKLRVAKGVIAIGQFAIGLITIAQFGIGFLFGFGQFFLALTAIAQVAADYPNLEVQDRARVKEENRRGVDQLLNLVGALLMLAIIIALFGIVNTLVLSVLERTRELGLLRAVGMTRRQVRTMVRTESIITSVMGAVLGLAIGVLFGVAIQKALESEGVDSLVVPVGSLIAYVLAAALAGVLAAVGPARKAAKLDVLQAISHE